MAKKQICLRNCENCGVLFGHDWPPSRVKSQPYCSKTCSNLARYKNHWTKVSCGYCGKIKKITLYRFNLYEIHYCNADCMSKHYQERLSQQFNPNFNNEWTRQQKIALSLKKTGKTIFNGFSSSKRKLLMGSKKYKEWRFAVYTRDDFTCQSCGLIGSGKLEAHHIKPVHSHPELVFEISNGVTLCVDCHCKVDKYRRRFIGEK